MEEATAEEAKAATVSWEEDQKAETETFREKSPTACNAGGSGQRPGNTYWTW